MPPTPPQDNLLLWSKCLCPHPPHSYVENVIPKVIALGGGAFGRWWGREGRAHRNGIDTLTKDALESQLIPSSVWRSKKKSAPRRWPLPGHADTRISGFQPPEWWEVNVCGLWATRLVVSCDSNPNRIRHLSNCKAILRKDQGAILGSWNCSSNVFSRSQQFYL